MNILSKLQWALSLYVKLIANIAKFRQLLRNNSSIPNDIDGEFENQIISGKASYHSFRNLSIHVLYTHLKITMYRIPFNPSTT
jgi:hypothetical protein